jgi:hypothetical protein
MQELNSASKLNVNQAFFVTSPQLGTGTSRCMG